MEKIEKLVTELKTDLKAYRDKVEELEGKQVDALDKEQLAKYEEAMDKQEKKLADLELQLQKTNMGIDNKGGQSEEYKAFDELLRYGKSNEMIITDDTTGGYLAVDAYRNRIIKKVDELSPIRQYAETMTIKNRALVMPVENTYPTANWANEIETVSNTKAAFKNLRIPLHALVGHVQVSEENLRFSEFNLEQIIADQVSRQFAITEGAAFVEGDGVGKPLGILESGEINNVGSSNTSLDADDFFDAYGNIKSYYAQNGVWLLNRDTITDVRKLKDGSGDYLWVVDRDLTGTFSPTLLNRPVVEATDMPDNSSGKKPIVFGDLRSGYLIVDAVGMTMLRDPYTLGNQRLVRYIWSKFTGGAVKLGEALTSVELS